MFWAIGSPQLAKAPANGTNRTLIHMISQRRRPPTSCVSAFGQSKPDCKHSHVVSALGGAAPLLVARGPPHGIASTSFCAIAVFRRCLPSPSAALSRRILVRKIRPLSPSQSRPQQPSLANPNLRAPSHGQARHLIRTGLALPRSPPSVTIMSMSPFLKISPVPHDPRGRQNPQPAQRGLLRLSPRVRVL